MPSFSDVQRLVAQTPNGPDVVRRNFLKSLADHTNRPTLLYAAKSDSQNPGVQINRGDVQLFMSALIGVTGDELDLVLHSPGGQAEATEQIVQYLRAKFRHLRIIVPQNAMSAATMLACAGNEIVMGKHSALGPIDPQVVMPSTGGGIAVPAQSILDEFGQAQQAINAGNSPILWVERLGAIPFGFFAQCAKLIQLSEALVKSWLGKYMLQGDEDAEVKAAAIAKWLSSNPGFLTHGRPIGIDEARARGLKVTPLEDDQELQDRVLSVFHATITTFMTTRCIKIVENHESKGTYVLDSAAKP